MFPLLRAEAIMLFGEIKGYKFNYIFYNLGVIVFFTGFIYNFNYQNSGLHYIFGLLYWHSFMSTIEYISNLIQDEAMMGTLEQLFMQQSSFYKIMIAKICINMIYTAINSTILLCLTILSLRFLGFVLYMPLLNNFFGITFIFILFMFLIITGYTIGFFFGGFSLYFKKAGAFLRVLSNILLFFTGVINVNKYNNFIHYLTPLSPLSDITNKLLDGEYNTILYSIFLFTLICCIYIFVSILTFWLFVKKAKQNGLLAQY